MTTSSFIGMPTWAPQPLSFEKVDDALGGSTLYPFKVKASRALFREEAQRARKVCADMFGAGGRTPEPGSRWFGDEARGLYSFKSSTDMVMFIVAMSG